MRDVLKEVESETGGMTYRNRIGGGADQGERAYDREALATKRQATYIRHSRWDSR